MIIRYGLTGILFWLLVIFSAYESMAQKESGKIKCICIDAGHGGFANKEGDPGAIGALTQEKHLTLGIALKLGKMISERYPDIRVVYTRTKDVPVELNKRGKIANDCKADLFISIHINSCKTLLCGDWRLMCWDLPETGKSGSGDERKRCNQA